MADTLNPKRKLRTRTNFVSSVTLNYSKVHCRAVLTVLASFTNLHLPLPRAAMLPPRDLALVRPVGGDRFCLCSAACRRCSHCLGRCQRPAATVTSGLTSHHPSRDMPRRGGGKFSHVRPQLRGGPSKRIQASKRLQASERCLDLIHSRHSSRLCCVCSLLCAGCGWCCCRLGRSLANTGHSASNWFWKQCDTSCNPAYSVAGCSAWWRATHGKNVPQLVLCMQDHKPAFCLGCLHLSCSAMAAGTTWNKFSLRLRHLWPCVRMASRRSFNNFSQRIQHGSS